MNLPRPRSFPDAAHFTELVDAVDRTRSAWLRNKDWAQSARLEAAAQDAKSDLCAWVTVNRDDVEALLNGTPGLREQAQVEAASARAA